MKMTAEYVEAVPAYGRGQNEDGPFEYIRGYQLHTAVRVEGGHLDHHLHCRLFDFQDQAEKLAEKVREAGLEIDDQHWDWVNRDHYRTDADRMEEEMQLAYRERMGMPL